MADLTADLSHIDIETLDASSLSRSLVRAFSAMPDLGHRADKACRFMVMSDDELQSHGLTRDSLTREFFGDTGGI